MNYKLCPKCNVYKELDNFHNSKRAKDGKVGTCKQCLKEVYDSEEGQKRAKRLYHSRKDKIQKYVDENRESIRLRNRNLTKRYKTDVVNHYGGKCDCCGESRLEFMTLEHINGDGGKKRKNKEHPKTGYALYKWIIKNGYPTFFGILCYNCNIAKGFYGYCPHEREK